MTVRFPVARALSRSWRSFGPESPRVPQAIGERVRLARAGAPAATRGPRGLGREPAGPEAGPFPRQGQAVHLPVHDRRAEPHGHVRPQAGAEQARRPAPAPQLRQDPQPVPGERPALPGESPQVGPVRPVRARHVGPRAAHAPARRRHRPDPLVRRRQRDPCAGHVSDEHRPGLHGLSEPGELGHLRARLGERGPAGVRRDDPARGDARRGGPVLGRRVPAHPVSGDAVPRRPEPHRQPEAAGRVHPATSSAGRSTCSAR